MIKARVDYQNLKKQFCLLTKVVTE